MPTYCMSMLTWEEHPVGMWSWFCCPFSLSWLSFCALVLVEHSSRWGRVKNALSLLCSFDDEIHPEHENDIYIAGYSDQILRFIAERGDGGQLIHVENIDQSGKYRLKSLPQSQVQAEQGPKVTPQPPKPLPLVSFIPRWVWQPRNVWPGNWKILFFIICESLIWAVLWMFSINSLLHPNHCWAEHAL